MAGTRVAVAGTCVAVLVLPGTDWVAVRVALGGACVAVAVEVAAPGTC